MKISTFEIDNAKNMPKSDVVETFVATDNFWRITAPKNHVILGSRGSGKTVLGKMLSHDYLSSLDDQKAKKIIKNKEFIGVYLPTNVEWVGALKNKSWKDEREKEMFFQWRLNVALGNAFLDTMISCIRFYSENDKDKLVLENKISRLISELWFDDVCDDIKSLRKNLDKAEIEAEVNITHRHVNEEDSWLKTIHSTKFATSLFSPVKWAIKAVSELIELNNKTYWIVCIDEAEFLEEGYQRIINTFMRASADSPTIYYKMITMPFCHYTLETNVNSPLNLGHDFDYIYIDQDPVKKEFGQCFVRDLFEKRMNHGHDGCGDLSLKELVGVTDILEKKELDWGARTEEFKLLCMYSSDETVTRARKLIKQGNMRKFRDQVGRKIYPALLMRKYRSAASKTGKSKAGVFSGEAMLVRCGDGNPRRIIRLINALLNETNTVDLAKKIRTKTLPVISKSKQETVFERFSKGTLYRVKSEPGIGPELFRLINMIGNYMKDRLYNNKLGTEQVFSIRIPNNAPYLVREGVHRATGLGLLFPHIQNQITENDMHSVTEYRLAYVLAPHFSLIPRRGRANDVLNIIKENHGGQVLLEVKSSIERCIA